MSAAGLMFAITLLRARAAESSSLKQIDVVDANTDRFALTAPAATFLVNLGGKYNRISPDHSMRRWR